MVFVYFYFNFVSLSKEGVHYLIPIITEFSVTLLNYIKIIIYSYVVILVNIKFQA